MVATTHLRSSKEQMWALGEQLGLKGDALMRFRHACGEVKVELDVDPDTGHAVIVRVDGRTVVE